jgi:hypothetical protein
MGRKPGFEWKKLFIAAALKERRLQTALAGMLQEFDD